MIWNATTQIENLSRNSCLYGSTVSKTIQEPVNFQPVVHDNTDTLELDEHEIKYLLDFIHNSEEDILGTYKTADIKSISELERLLHLLSQKINDSKKTLQHEVEKNYSIKRLISDTTDIFESISFLKKYTHSLGIVTENVSKHKSKIVKNSFIEAGPSCMVFTNDLSKNSLITHSIASCLAISFVYKSSDGIFKAALLHLNDHFSVYMYELGNLEEVVEKLLKITMIKLGISNSTDLWTYVCGGQMYDENDYATRICYFASALLAIENGWVPDSEPLSEFYERESDLMTTLSSFGGEDIRKYYNKLRTHKDYLAVYKDSADANTHFIDERMNKVYLKYMKDENQHALSALLSGQEYAIVVEDTLKRNGCNILSRKFNLPSNLSTYSTKTMKPLTVTISIDGLPTIMATRETVEVPPKKILLTRINEEKVGKKLGIAIPSLDLDNAKSLGANLVPFGFLKISHDEQGNVVVWDEETR